MAQPVTLYISSVASVRKTADDCRMAQAILTASKVDHVCVDIASDPEVRKQMEAKSGKKGVPQLFVGDQFVADGATLFMWNEDGAAADQLRQAGAKFL